MIDDPTSALPGEPYRWSEPRHLACPACPHAPNLAAGSLDPVWQRSPWSEPFVDILGEEPPTPRWATRVKALWDAQALYLLAHLEEPHLWATLTEHDSVIFQDHDFEVFLDPDGDSERYVELEINALNTTWDLLLPRAYRVGGPPVDGFELAGLRSAVRLMGTLNDPSDHDEGWEVAIAIPWRALHQVAGVPCPPAPGDVWRINFSRVQWTLDVVDGHYVKREGVPEDNWVWSPQGMVDMHQPERWGFLHFQTEHAPLAPPRYPVDARWLSAFFHSQRALPHFATDVQDVPGVWPKDLVLLGTRDQFRAWLGDWSIDHDGRLRSSV